MIPRPYQIEAMEAVEHHLRNFDTNPCVVLPTASGKTPTMAWLIQQWMRQWSDSRFLVLAHVKELLEQGVSKLNTVWPDAPAGVYCNGLKSKDLRKPITYASIQSIHRKAFDMDPPNVVFVDEAHRIPLKGETTYRKFLTDLRVVNPHVRVVGWTATPYRLGGGPICDPDYILHEVCYEAGVRKLIDNGYLCRLTSKIGDESADMTGVRRQSGDFRNAEMAAKFRAPAKVRKAVGEALSLSASRRHRLWFGANVKHATEIAQELGLRGEQVELVTGDSPSNDRDRILKSFVAGKLRNLVNVAVLTEGFDAPCIDCVIMLRATDSAALYYQIVGRALRLHPDKADALILDFGGNIMRHGPIDGLYGEEKKKAISDGTQMAPHKRCPNCKEVVHAGCRECPECGAAFEIDATPKHETKPSPLSILTDDKPWDCKVIDVKVTKHEKPGKPASLKVTYYGALERHSEWVCLEHDGFAKQKAVGWWWKRFREKPPTTVDQAIQDMFLGHKIKQVTREIAVRRQGRFTEIVNYSLNMEVNEYAA